MNEDRGIGAMPKLYGAPAYARPPAQPVNSAARPFDPDDLPLEAERTHEEQEALSRLAPHASPVSVAPAEPSDGGSAASDRLPGRPFRLRLPGLAGRPKHPLGE